MPGFNPSCSALHAVATEVAPACSNARTMARCRCIIKAVISMLASPVGLVAQLVVDACG
jgi:hypothetical protein